MHYQFGPALQDGWTEFRLWAPDAEQIIVEIEGAETVPLASRESGWHTATMPVSSGTRYRFRLPDGQMIPDPASRSQPDGVLGPSMVIDPNEYQWKQQSWRGRPWHETVIYEVHTGLLGGFSGLAGHLPALAEMGFTAIQLMPIAEFSGSRNWGYDGVLPYAPSHAYGSLAELKALVDCAHGLGLMVFIDVVYNHFGPDGNFLPVYAPTFFRDDIHTPWGAAIDFRRPEVRRFFIDNARMWIGDYRFDGLRLDAVHAISEPDWVPQMAAELRAEFPDRHVHIMLENEANQPEHLRGTGAAKCADAQWNDDFHNVMHVLLTGETHAYYADFADRPIERLACALAEGFVYQGQATPSQHGRKRGAPSADLPPTAFINFLQNHDQIGNRALGEKLLTLAGPRANRAATVLLLLAPSIPMVFMGEEEGSTNPFLFFTDFHDALADAVREGRRREFARFPAFVDPDKRAQIPDPNEPATFEASRPRPGPDAATWRRLFTDLLTLRRDRIVPYLPNTLAIGAQPIGPKSVCAQWRLGNGERLTIAANFGTTPLAADLPCTIPIWGQTDTCLPPLTTLVWLDPA